ncbi:MAG: cytochrome-c oxidase, cbb3-type subunit I [Phycisphaerales bacterium]|nr:cytochrome-c oxidase, cbb3-type subunit I [Phycisphaerales bacterium]
MGATGTTVIRATGEPSAATGGGEAGVAEGGFPVERFVYDDKIVRAFMLMTLVWGLVAFLVGIIIAVQLAFPAANLGLSFTSFGRLRPLHTNAAIFAFAGNAIFAAIYYSTQRLCKARMFSDRLSWLHFWGWQAVIVSAALTLPLGITQGKEYAELEWPIDLLIAVVWVGFFGVNFFGTLARRRERHMYVALWFYIATIVTVAVLHVFNNIWVPVGFVHLLNTGEFLSAEVFMKSYPVYAGVQDAFMQWWYGHNAVAFFLTTPFLGMMYYFMPKAANRPVFSYRLSIIHFRSLVFMYIWAGPHHLHYTALPGWASTLGMLFSVMLWMPSWGGGINGLLTLRGAWGRVTADPVLKFFVVGVTFYMMSTFEGPMLSIKTINALSHYTDWTVAHVHGGTLGWNGFMVFGMIYYLMPRLFQTQVYSQRLVGAHFWIATIGILLYVIPIYVAGLTQGLMWRAFDESGVLKYPEFVETVSAVIPLYWVRVAGGLLYFAGAVMCAYNMLLTWRARPARFKEQVHEAPSLRFVPIVDPRRPVSELTSNVEWGKAFDVWSTGWWHRIWERKPLRFTLFVAVAVGVASLFEMIPTFLIRSNVPTIASVKPYTPLELAGRDIYVAEGCYNCHSQMIRPIYAETKRYGEYSKPGEFVYDHPFQWGSRRIGPDLAREGGARSDLWHLLHLRAPADTMQGSIMPRYPWLIATDLDFKAVQARVNAMAMLGVPYGKAVLDGAAEKMAREQSAAIAQRIREQGAGSLPGDVPADIENKQVIALIAYLQRLGTDISSPTGAAAPAPATTK